MAPWGGLEPPTGRLEGGCSVQLSYQGTAATYPISMIPGKRTRSEAAMS